MIASDYRIPALILLVYVWFGTIQECNGVKLCAGDLLPIPLGLEECNQDICIGQCFKGTNPEGYVFDLCCADPKAYTCYNQSDFLALRQTCYNATSENDTACKAFEMNVQCVSNLYNKTYEECRWQYLDLYQMIFTTSKEFNPRNCPCETNYTKTSEPCPCLGGSDACGTNMGQEDICCFKDSYLKQALPCSSSEHYLIFDEDTCSAKTCRGRCENTTAYGQTGNTVCCISTDDLRADDSPHSDDKTSNSAGPIVGAIIAVLVVVSIFTGLVVYLRKSGKCTKIQMQLKKKRKKTEYDDIQMQTRHENAESRDTGTFSNVL